MFRRTISLLDGMQYLYTTRNPTYEQTIEKLRETDVLLKAVRKRVPNDHIAVRTLAMPVQGLGLGTIDRFLRRFDYTARDEYVFPEKKLFARWYSPPNAVFHLLPRIFVSELRVDQLSPNTQGLFLRYVAKRSALQRYLERSDENDDKESSVPEAIEAIDEKLYDDVPSRADFEAIRRETEYGAWTLLHGQRVNHCTISTSLFAHPFYRLASFVPFASRKLAISFAGNIQISDDNKLMQISTTSEQGAFLFAGDAAPVRVNGSFVEFIERKREGFEAKNATRIFETTDMK